jgi:hypothetical protein
MSFAVSRSRSPLILAVAGLAVFMTAAVLTLAIWNADGLPQNWAWALAIVFFLFAPPFLVLTHELGHLLTALALGWRVPILAVGGFSLRFSPLRFSAGAPPFRGASGAIVAVPPAHRGGRAGWIAVHAGGPASDFLVAALAASVALNAPPDAMRHDVSLVVAAIAATSALFNLLPFARRGGGASDGMQILVDLAGRHVVSRGRRARLFAEMIDGKRPRDWDIALVRAVEADSAWTGNSDGALYVYTWHLDRGEPDAARAALVRGAANDALDDFILVEQAFIAAMLDNRPEEARRFLSRVPLERVAHDPAFWRARAAASLAERDGPALREALVKWRNACKDWVYTTQFEWDWLARVTQDAQALETGRVAA